MVEDFDRSNINYILEHILLYRHLEEEEYAPKHSMLGMERLEVSLQQYLVGKGWLISTAKF